MNKNSKNYKTIYKNLVITCVLYSLIPYNLKIANCTVISENCKYKSVFFFVLANFNLNIRNEQISKRHKLKKSAENLIT